MDEQTELLGFLARSETYGVDRVERLETHASVIFLAGERAYKLKKAVRYSYLDYSTREKRRAACEAELAVNRRFAPELYLGVKPVTRSARGELALDGEGEAIDWLLVMRRFASAAQLDHMAEGGALTREIMTALADRIASVHETSEIRHDFGGAHGLESAIAGCIENLRLAIEQGLPAADVESWAERAGAAVARLAPLLERRRLAGKVRSCHGDLHLQNICLWEGRPMLFDGIEFDPTISNIDVLYDLAFLLMDLRHRRLDSFASLIFNRYLDRCHEADGLAALPLFISVRAAVRAQVTAAAASQSRDAARIFALRDQAKSYLTLAVESLEPARPRLVVLGGFSGTGKSTLAVRMAPSLDPAPGARVFRSDVIRKQLAGVEETARLQPSFYTAKAHAEIYRRLASEATSALEAGRSVIIDAVCGRRSEQEALAALARKAGLPFDGLWLEAPTELLERRIEARRRDASDATIAVLHGQLVQAEPPEGWRKIDASGDPEAMARAALAALGLGAQR
jgi:uncharacterized protein